MWRPRLEKRRSVSVLFCGACSLAGLYLLQWLCIDVFRLSDTEAEVLDIGAWVCERF